MGGLFIWKQMYIPEKQQSGCVHLPIAMSILAIAVSFLLPQVSHVFHANRNILKFVIAEDKGT